MTKCKNDQNILAKKFLTKSVRYTIAYKTAVGHPFFRRNGELDSLDCSQLWMPIKPVEILKIEKLQKDFLNRIPALRGNNYWQKLKMKPLSNKLTKFVSLSALMETIQNSYMLKRQINLQPGSESHPNKMIRSSISSKCNTHRYKTST